MNIKLTRRAALALPFAVPAIGTIDALAAEPTAPPEPKPVIIDGLNQIADVQAVCLVRTADGRSGIVTLRFDGDTAGVRVKHAILEAGHPDRHLTAHLPVDPYATLPAWLTRELGFAALAATKDGAK